MTLQEFLDNSDRSLRENAAAIGISPSYLCEIKEGTREPSPAMARKIVNGTGGLVSFAEVYGEKVRKRTRRKVAKC